MQPLSVDNESDLDKTIWISAFSTISSINSNPPYFMMHATQYIAGGQSSDNIAIRAVLSKNPKWQNPSECLPQPKAVIGIWGKLDHFDIFTYSSNKSTTCVIVNVEDITYLFNPKQDPAEKTASTLKKSKLQQKFNKHTHTSQSSPISSPSSSQKQLGKCPARSSEDEVDQHM
jgi:hypothetical protein